MKSIPLATLRTAPRTMLTSKFLVITAISTIMLLANVSTKAEIYKWTDAKGVTHYSAQKPTQRKIKSKNIEDEIRSAAGKYQAPSRTASQANAESESSEKGDNKKKPKLAGPSAKLVAYCKTQRKNLAGLKKNFRNSWQGKDGKKTRLDQKQRQAKVTDIQKSITQECAGV